jgi:UrcA family protein
LLAAGSFAVDARNIERAAELPRVTVRYTDLNLNTRAGVEALYARLRAAARDVCSVGLRRSLNDVMASKRCYRQTLATAVETIKWPTLSALHRAETTRDDLS